MPVPSPPSHPLQAHGPKQIHGPSKSPRSLSHAAHLNQSKGARDPALLHTTMSTDDFAGDAGVALSADAGADADALGLGPDSDSVAASSSPKPPQRVLACLLCQQRKIKCNRQCPCSNCTRTGAHCVPAGLVPRQRRRRFPERELLDRVRHYEALLRQHSVSFEPLHPPPPNAPSASPILSSAGTGTSSPDIARSVVTSPSLSEAPRAYAAGSRSRAHTDGNVALHARLTV